MTFPTPVGGTPFAEDFAPSIVFAILYALLIPIMFFRVYDKHSRTTLLIGSVIFGVERVVIFSLRAAQSHTQSMRLSKGLLQYMQASFALGFLGIANDLVNIVAVYLINPTYGSDMYQECVAAHDERLGREEVESGWTPPERRVLQVFPLSRPRPVHKGDFPGEPLKGTPDHPRIRYWARRFRDFMGLAFMAASIPGGVVNGQYSTTATPAKSRQLMTLRYESTAVGMFLLFIIAAANIWGRVKLSRVSMRGSHILSVLCVLLSIIGIYRLSVMFHETTSLTSRAPGSLNSRGAKASFYVLHVLPEWVALTIIFGFNIRQTFGTGIIGDIKNKDETPKQREKREKREAKQAEKRRQKRLAAMGVRGEGDKFTVV